MDFNFSPPPDFTNSSSSSSPFPGESLDFFGNAASNNNDMMVPPPPPSTSNDFSFPAPPPPPPSSSSGSGFDFGATDTSFGINAPPVGGGGDVPASEFGFMDSIIGNGSSSSSNPVENSIPRLDTSDALRGNIFASASSSGFGNGTTEKESLRKQFLRQKMLGRLAKWQSMGILDSCLVEDHDFTNKDAVRNYTFEYVKDIFDYYRMRKDTVAYTDLLTSTFRETASNLETYLVKKHDCRSFQGITNKIEEDYELYHDDFEEYGEMLANINMPGYVMTGLRVAKTVAGVIAANAALTNLRTGPKRLRNAMAYNPNLEKEYFKTHYDMMTGAASSATQSAQAVSEQYEDAIRDETTFPGSGGTAKKRRLASMSLADRIAMREEEERKLALMLNRHQPSPDAPRPPPPIDTRTIDPMSEEGIAASRPPMKGLAVAEKEFEDQVDIEGIFANNRASKANVDLFSQGSIII